MKKGQRLFFALISLLVFVVLLLVVVFKNPLIDALISENISKIWSQSLNKFFIFLGHYSSEIMIALAIFFGLIFFASKKRKEGIFFLSTLALGWIINYGIKFIVGRTRPLSRLITEEGFSFPSGHSFFVLILFSFMIYLYKDKIKNKSLRIIFISSNLFLILLIGFSRIYLNVHFFTDVIGGFVFGLFVFNLSIWIKERYFD